MSITARRSRVTVFMAVGAKVRRYELIPEMAHDDETPPQLDDEDPNDERASGPTEERLVETESSQLLRVALPVLGHLDMQVEIDRHSQQVLDITTCHLTDVAQPRALVADDDRLLAGPLDIHGGVDVGEGPFGWSVLARCAAHQRPQQSNEEARRGRPRGPPRESARQSGRLLARR